jgi:hypothetical protein
MDFWKVIVNNVADKKLDLYPTLKMYPYYVNFLIYQYAIEATYILKRGIDKNDINKGGLSANPNPRAVEYLLKKNNTDKIEWHMLSANTNPRAVEHMLQNFHFIFWYEFCKNSNPKAVEYIIQHPDKIIWFEFSRNANPKAVEYMFQHPNKINWSSFSANSNPKAVKYLLRNPDKIDWVRFSSNPSIFEINRPLFQKRLKRI